MGTLNSIKAGGWRANRMSVQLRIDTAVFSEKIQRYQQLTGKGMSEVVTEQAKLLATRLTKLTYPGSASQGKKRVEIDVGRVFLRNSWFEDTFQFHNAKLGDKVKSAVRAKEADTLRVIFDKSPKLSRIHIESFQPSKHKAARRDGRVNYPAPFSFPLTEQGRVKKYIAERKRAVGTARSGWAAAERALGGSSPGWLTKEGTGGVENNAGNPESPSITLINRVSYFATLDRKANILSRALDGRGRDMIKSAEHQLARAAKEAGLAG